jgi:hypothetical protein
MEDLSTFSAKPRLRLLLDHFAKIKDTRQAWKVAHPAKDGRIIATRDKLTFKSDDARVIYD